MKSLLVTFFCICTSFAFAQQAKLPTVQLSVEGKQISAEVANTQQQREVGLMHRTQIPQNGGMLFVFDNLGTVCMWMENTLIPLSVAFMGEDGTIINIADMQPKTRDLHCSLVPARYALEMKLGWFKKNKIGPGASFKGLPDAIDPSKTIK